MFCGEGKQRPQTREEQKKTTDNFVIGPKNTPRFSLPLSRSRSLSSFPPSPLLNHHPSSPSPSIIDTFLFCFCFLFFVKTKEKTIGGGDRFVWIVALSTEKRRKQRKQRERFNRATKEGKRRREKERKRERR